MNFEKTKYIVLKGEKYVYVLGQHIRFIILPQYDYSI